MQVKEDAYDHSSRLSLVGIITAQVFGLVQEDESKECNNVISFNASKGSCFHTWLGEEVGIDP
jgi:hypothetical protein